MFAVTAARIDADDPLSGLELGEHPDPSPPDGWTTVTVRAAALNHHDVWTLRGVGISADRLPIVVGCDAAGTDEDGRDVIVHSVIGDPLAGGGDETLDPRRSLLSERYDGTFAERVAVPRRNLVPKPAALSFTEAACLPTAYLTAYRMLFDQVRPAARGHDPGPGGGRRCRDRSHRARAGGGLPRLGDQPRRGASGTAPWNSAPTRSSRPGPGCRSGSTRSWRRSARPPGPTRCGLSSPGAGSWSAARPAAPCRRPT